MAELPLDQQNRRGRFDAFMPGRPGAVLGAPHVANPPLGPKGVRCTPERGEPPVSFK